MGLLDAYHEWQEKQYRKKAELFHKLGDKMPIGRGLYNFIGDCHEKLAGVHANGGRQAKRIAKKILDSSMPGMGLMGIFLKAFLGSFAVDKYIDEDVAQEKLEELVASNLRSGNYETVNLGLTAEVSDINTIQDNTEISFAIECEDDNGCEVKLCTQYGTSLEKGDRLQLTFG